MEPTLADGNVADCQADDVHIRPEGYSRGTGHYLLFFDVENAGRTICSLGGVYTVVGYQEDRRLFTVSGPIRSVTPHPPVVLHPGQNWSLYLDSSSADATGPGFCTGYDAVTIIAPGGHSAPKMTISRGEQGGVPGYCKSGATIVSTESADGP